MDNVKCRSYGRHMITVLKADITSIDTDVIVNSANPSLGGIGPDLPEGVGGVDGAIHRKAGIGLFNACRALPTVGKIEGEQGNYSEVRCFPGDYKITDAFNLNAKYVIHAVAPMNILPNLNKTLDENLTLLDGLYKKIFAAFEGLNEKRILIPPLGTRSFGMPKKESAFIAFHNARDFLKTHSGKHVVFSVIDPQEYQIYRFLGQAEPS